jgi:hypothetical protein
LAVAAAALPFCDSLFSGSAHVVVVVQTGIVGLMLKVWTQLTLTGLPQLMRRPEPAIHGTDQKGVDKKEKTSSEKSAKA